MSISQHTAFEASFFEFDQPVESQRPMIRFAFYGKGGIGKSTTAANVAAALAESGKTVMLIGCDPKADSTSLLRDKPQPTVLELLRSKHKSELTLDDMVKRGRLGVLCVEAGGPRPGLGCAGRGIIAAFEALKAQRAFDVYEPDVVIFDVLGDVVCGGFAMPIRDGWAQNIFIVTSGENMAIHAAANIATAVETFSERGYARLGGIILNSRNVPHEQEKVNELAQDLHSTVIDVLPRSQKVQLADELRKTVIEAAPSSAMADHYRALAQKLLEAAQPVTVPAAHSSVCTAEETADCARFTF